MRLKDTFTTSSPQVKVRVDTLDGTGTGGEDYVEIHEVITFRPEELEKEIEVHVIDDVEWEPDEDFYLKVSVSVFFKLIFSIYLGFSGARRG